MIEIIQPHEEKDFIIYYTNQITDIINRKIPSRSLKTYAMSFFRRFFLKKTAIDYDPEFLLCASIYLGCKVAQLNITLDTMKNVFPFLKEIHQEKNIENILILLEYEFYLINVINYDFYVFCPYKAMVGFIHTISKSQKDLNLLPYFDDKNKTKEFESKCENLIDVTFYTDLIFLISYSYIGLSCIFIVAENEKLNLEFIKKLLKLDDVLNYDHFYKFTLPTVNNYLNNVKIYTENEFVDKKKRILKFLYRNPKYVERIEKDREY